MVTLLLFSAGCLTAKTYDGERQSKESIGMLHISAGLLNPYESVVVVSIDGKQDPEWSTFKSRYRHFELLPGQHTIVVQHVTQSDQQGNVQFSSMRVSKAAKREVMFDVEAGHDYTLNYSVRGKRITIIDAVTKVEVAEAEWGIQK